MNYEEKKQRRKERAKMTHAERWLTREKPKKPNQAAIVYADFRERWMPKNNVFRG